MQEVDWGGEESVEHIFFFFSSSSSDVLVDAPKYTTLNVRGFVFQIKNFFF